MRAAARLNTRDLASQLQENPTELTAFEKVQQHKEKLRIARQQGLDLAFRRVEEFVRDEVKVIDEIKKNQARHGPSEVTMRRVQMQEIVRMLAEFEEFSDYENIFTGNNRSEAETRALNQRIITFVIKCFKVPNVHFSKEFNEDE